MMILMDLSLSIYNCNTSGFVISGSKFSNYFWKLTLRKELNLSQISLEFDETLQLYSACLNKQKSQRWHPSIFHSVRDTNPKFKAFAFTKNTNLNGDFVVVYIPSNIKLVKFLKFQHYIFIILFLVNLRFFYGDYLEI